MHGADLALDDLAAAQGAAGEEDVGEYLGHHGALVGDYAADAAGPDDEYFAHVVGLRWVAAASLAQGERDSVGRAHPDSGAGFPDRLVLAASPSARLPIQSG
ncbi:MAG: hypothetical protein Tsb0020_24500 [Haliangiales bacterium]